MLKAYKYRIYPTPSQIVKIDNTINICRFIYNLGLETKMYAWRSAKINISTNDLINQLPELKKANPWLKEVNSQSIQYEIKKIESAFIGFYRGKGFPKFKSKRSGVQSFQCPSNTRRIDWNNSLLTIPKIQDIPIRISRKFEGCIKTITISKKSNGKYYASILVDNNTDIPKKNPIDPKTTIGLDVGIKSFVVTSDGRQFEPNRFLKNSLKRLQCLQRRANRKQKGSNNRKKANKCVSILYEKVTNQRIDYTHKVTTKLICDNQTESFVIEDLSITNMLKNNKLSQAISDVSWGEFYRQMKYKCEWHGKNLIKINRFLPSSKRCFDCGQINHDLTLATREWKCGCGSYHNRDINAAKNIKYFGLNN